MRPTAEEVSRRRKRGLELEAVEAPSRIGVVSTFNVDLIAPFLAEALDRRGVARGVHLTGYGQYQQEILDEASALYEAEPTEVLLMPAVADLLAPLYDSAAPRGDVDALVSERVDELDRLVRVLIERLPSATVFLAMIGGAVPNPHVLNAVAPERGQLAVERLLHSTRELAGRDPRIVDVDWSWHEARSGLGPVRDERLWYLARMRLAPPALAALSEVVARHVAARTLPPRKVVVVDLDDTLWGGIVGEVGVGGLVLGDEGIGLAYRDFQRELLRIREAGAMLAVCSKNNPDEALEAIERHPGMVIGKDDLSAMRINWSDKASSLREIAAELNVGIDSMVFIDDSPVEREWVRSALPEVLVPDLPEDPVNRPTFLAGSEWVTVLELTDADRLRTAGQRTEGRRRTARSEAPSLEEFIASLEQVVTFAPVDELTIQRAAQLAARTNQFNLTTRRESAAEITAWTASPDHEVETVSVSDRFGDSGIVGLIVLRFDDGSAHIDGLMLSCRVLGRAVEDAVLARIAGRAQARGAQRLVGHYAETERNAQAQDFYSGRGFEQVGPTEFRCDLAAESFAPPAGVRMREPAGA